jgi:hypothetical protein
MPILGEVWLRSYSCRLQELAMYQLGYIAKRYVIVMRDGVRISLYAPVTLAIDFEGSREGFVLVKRIGKGISEDDFEIDFQYCQSTVFDINPEESFPAEEYILFSYPYEPNLHRIDYRAELKQMSMRSLEDELKEALEAQNYPRAAKIRDEINRRKGTNQRNKK